MTEPGSDDADFLAAAAREGITPENAAAVRASLRYAPDDDIINPFGEHCWLKQVTKQECEQNFIEAGIDPSRAYGYLTECCDWDEECEHHAQVRKDRCLTAATMRSAPTCEHGKTGWHHIGLPAHQDRGCPGPVPPLKED